VIAVYVKDRAKRVNTLSGQNVEFSGVEVGGSYSNHRAVDRIESAEGCRHAEEGTKGS
jgi:hypothetical protein